MAGKSWESVKSRIFKEYRLADAGTKLPPINALMQLTGAHRATVEKALDQLLVEGVLAYRVTTGLVVTGLGLEETVEQSELAQTLEFRLLIEPAAARDAASCVAKSLLEKGLIAEFDTAYRALNDAFDKRVVDRAFAADRDFHQAMFRLVQNPLMRVSMLRVNMWLMQNVKEVVSKLFDDVTYRRTTKEQHASIHDAVIGGRPDEAFDAMTVHLNFAHKEIIRALVR